MRKLLGNFTLSFWKHFLIILSPRSTILMKLKFFLIVQTRRRNKEGLSPSKTTLYVPQKIPFSSQKNQKFRENNVFKNTSDSYQDFSPVSSKKKKPTRSPMPTLNITVPYTDFSFFGQHSEIREKKR